MISSFDQFFSFLFSNSPVEIKDNQNPSINSVSSDYSCPGASSLHAFFSEVSDDIKTGIDHMSTKISTFLEDDKNVTRLKGVGAIVAGILLTAAVIALMATFGAELGEFAGMGISLIIAGSYMAHTGKAIGYFH